MDEEGRVSTRDNRVDNFHPKELESAIEFFKEIAETQRKIERAKDKKKFRERPKI